LPAPARIGPLSQVGIEKDSLYRATRQELSGIKEPSQTHLQLLPAPSGNVGIPIPLQSMFVLVASPQLRCSPVLFPSELPTRHVEM
jgi:hypothetical protein